MRRIAALLALACSAHGFRGSRVGRRSRAAAVEYLTRPQDAIAAQQQRPPVRLTPRPASAVTSTSATTAQTPSTGKKKVLFLMSDTGGGHRASATALRDGFEVLYGDKYEINVVDLWSSSSPWPLVAGHLALVK